MSPEKSVPDQKNETQEQKVTEQKDTEHRDTEQRDTEHKSVDQSEQKNEQSEDSHAHHAHENEEQTKIADSDLESAKATSLEAVMPDAESLPGAVEPESENEGVIKTLYNWFIPRT